MNEHIEDILVGGRPMTKSERLQKRLDDIKNYLKQVHEETNHGIISSEYLIFLNIERLCDGKDLIKEEEK